MIELAMVAGALFAAAVMMVFGVAVFMAGVWFGDKAASNGMFNGLNISEQVRANLFAHIRDDADPKDDPGA